MTCEKQNDGDCALYVLSWWILGIQYKYTSIGHMVSVFHIIEAKDTLTVVTDFHVVALKLLKKSDVV